MTHIKVLTGCWLLVAAFGLVFILVAGTATTLAPGPEDPWLETGTWLMISGHCTPVLDLSRDRTMGVHAASDTPPSLEWRASWTGEWSPLNVAWYGGLKYRHTTLNYRWLAVFPTPDPVRERMALPSGQRYGTIEVRLNGGEPMRLVVAW